MKPGTSATAFALLINSGDTPLTNCRPMSHNGLANVTFTFSYQTTNASNQLTGSPNASVNLAPGASQNFVLIVGAPQSAAENSVISPAVSLVCNEATAPDVSGVNDFQVGVGSAVPDIIPIIATPTPGIAEITALGGAGAMAVAAVNIGAQGTITVLPGASLLPPNISTSICETNSSGACIASPSTAALVSFGAGQTRTFTVFFQQAGADPSDSGTPFMPDAVRLGVSFFQLGVSIPKRGASSVAFRSPDPGRGPVLRDGNYSFVFDNVATRERGLAITATYFSALKRFYMPLTGNDAFAISTRPHARPLGFFIDAIAASGPSPTAFSDARLLVQSQDTDNPTIFYFDNYSLSFSDTASAGFKFEGHMGPGTGANALALGTDAIFRSTWAPFGSAVFNKNDFTGSFVSSTSGEGISLTVSPAAPGAPMTFTGQAAPKVAGGTACPISGKLTPVADNQTPYMAELTLTTPPGADCNTTLLAGTYDGTASFGFAQPQAIPPRPASIGMAFSPLRRGLRSEVVSTGNAFFMKQVSFNQQ